MKRGEFIFGNRGGCIVTYLHRILFMFGGEEREGERKGEREQERKGRMKVERKSEIKGERQQKRGREKTSDEG